MTEKLVQFSPEWFAERRRILDGIADASQRRGTRWTPDQVRRSSLASRVALGDEDAQRDYERGAFEIPESRTEP